MNNANIAALPTTNLGALGDYRHLLIPVALMGILVPLLVPLPTFALDVLIALNLTLSVVVLMSCMYIPRPIDFSVFPSLLLLLTLFRLALNIASTRLILLHGTEGVSAAGKVIQAFGNFVVGGSFIVGVVVFLVMIVIQYIVVNHGAVRISEVRARFTLDALPGKQMSIDADLNAGIIDEREARSMRAALAQEAEFYGAMDGAIRFTQRDAIAGILIILINIIAGFLIGVLQSGMSPWEALQTYTVLTVGDGLVTAIPSLLISVGGGMLTTKASVQTDLGTAIAGQVFGNSAALAFAAAIIGLLGLIPGMPKMSFFVLAIMTGVAAHSVRKFQRRQIEEKAIEDAKPEATAPEKVESLLRVDPLAVEIGFGLINLVDPAQGGDFLQRVKVVRRQLAQEIGIIVPPIHVVDNLRLNSREYSILLRGVPIAKGELMQQHLLAINSGQAQDGLEGMNTKDPAFNLDAKWIVPHEKERAIVLGYAVVDPATVLVTHMTEVIKHHAYELLGRQEIKSLLDAVAETHPKVVEELVPKFMSLGEVQKILHNLLREAVPVRDLVTILETLADFAPATRNPLLLTEYVRQSLSRAICANYTNENDELLAFTLSPELDQSVTQAITHNEHMSVWNPDPRFAKDLLNRIRNTTSPGGDSSGVLVCSSSSRPHVKQLVAPYLPKLAVLSPNEIPMSIKFVSLGMVK
jgi:flagellar biosynthesis protein FlhA